MRTADQVHPLAPLIHEKNPLLMYTLKAMAEQKQKNPKENKKKKKKTVKHKK